MADGLPQPPRLDNDRDGRLWQYLRSLGEMASRLTGSGPRAAVTINDLQEAAATGGGRVGDVLKAIVIGTPQGGGPEDLTPPPAPTGFKATRGTGAVLIEFDAGVYAAGNGHGRTIVYAAPVLPGNTQTFSQAIQVAEAYAGPLAVPIQAGDNLSFWVRHQSHDEQVNDVMAGALAGGTHGLIPTDGAIDDAKFLAVSVARLVGGSMSVGQFIQSSNFNDTLGTGWKLDASTGQLTANYAVLRGAVYANAGQIGGAQIGPNFMQTLNFDSAGKVGWRLNNDGTAQLGGLLVAANGIRNVDYEGILGGFSLLYTGAGLLGSVLGSNIRWSKDGVTIASQAFTLTPNGSANFRGDITGATGTFSGRLRAETVMDALLGNVQTVEFGAPAAQPYTVTVPQIAPGVNVTSVRLTCVGGGGGASAASPTGEPDQFWYGVGGHAGQVTRTTVADLAVGGLLQITVGPGGIGGQFGTANTGGSAGGTTLVQYQPSISGSLATIAQAAGGGPVGTAASGLSGITYGERTTEGERGRGGNGWPDQDTATLPTGTNPTVNGGQGKPGYVLVEFYDKNTVVTGARYERLIEWLDGLGHGPVPANAR